MTLLKAVPLTLLLSLALTGCCELAPEPDYCIIPTTNNPDITRHSNAGWKPGASY